MPELRRVHLPFFLATALGFGLAAASPGHAADPAAKCQKATAKALSSCIRSVNKAEVGCFKKTGGACAAGDPKVARALAKVEKTLGKGCVDPAVVAEAGYAPLDTDLLIERFQTACTREVGDIAERIFGGGASPDEKCLLAAGKDTGTTLAKLIKATACVGKSCDSADLDKADAKRTKLEETLEQKLARKCPDLAGLVGLDAAGLVAETAARVTTATAAPCDPTDDGHCLFPFSNDYFTVVDTTSPTGRRLHFASEAMPTNSSDMPIDPTKWHVVDGFSVGPMLLTLEAQLDLAMSNAPPITDFAASLDPSASYVLLDAQTGEQQLLFVERDVSAPLAETPEDQAIIARVGRNLENDKRYLVALRGLVDASGAALPVNAVFAAYRDRTPTAQLPVEARRAEMEALFASLEAFGVARADLHLAWSFTTQSVESTSSKLLAMRDDAFDNVLGSAAPAFTVDTVVEPSEDVFRRVDGTFQAPLYLTEGGVPGSELRLGEDGLPANEGDFFTAPFTCVIPHEATTGSGAPAVPARPSLYGHGLLGEGTQANSSHVQAFASEHNFILCGTDWTGFADEDEPTVFEVLGDFSNFPKFIERQHQGVLNFMVLGRLLLHPDGFASDPAFQVGGESMIDPSELFYDGNSQGGILGGVLAAFSQDIERFVLGVPGINYSTLLNRSVDFDDFGAILSLTYPSALDRQTLLAVSQILWDQTDPSGHVRHTTSDPYPNTPAKKLLYQVAFGDHQVAPYTVEVAARSNGTPIHTPVLTPERLAVLPEVDPYYDIPAIPGYPHDGSAVVIWDSGNPPPPIVNNPPPAITDESDPGWFDISDCARSRGGDPHECPRREPQARLQKSEFLRTDGAVIDVCGGLACVEPAP